MVFNSLVFLLFLVVVLAGYLLVGRSWRLAKTFLLVANNVFYGAWSPPFVLLLWVSILVDWVAGRLIAGAPTQRRRRLGLVASLVANLGLLGYFKYGQFFLDNSALLLGSLGISFQPPAVDIVLPVGISFYTFQSMSYTMDIYRGRSRPWHSFVDFAVYVTFFPQLVAGPIVRAHDFLPQLSARRRASGAESGRGLLLLVMGLVQKMVLADAWLAPVADRVYSQPQQAGSLDAWAGTLAFAGQIFFDFAGYSTCAMGVALLFGFHLPVNFRSPYAACGFSDFWRRWHISLSTFLRDYLYIPLGGSRQGTVRTGFNLMITMLLGGLWHGAAWHFVAWGGLHGFLLAGEHGVRTWWSRRPRVLPAWGHPLLVLGTGLLTCLAWTLFRAPDLASAGELFCRLLWPVAGGLVPAAEMALVGFLTIALLAGQWWLRHRDLIERLEGLPAPLLILLISFLLVALALAPGEDRAFIYFQF
ncbi:MAG: MBOAT family O-acyltransferase [Thermodesulfobacteriota bacterium]